MKLEPEDLKAELNKLRAIGNKHENVGQLIAVQSAWHIILHYQKENAELRSLLRLAQGSLDEGTDHATHVDELIEAILDE